MMHVLNWGWIVFAISVQAFVTTQKHDGGKSRSVILVRQQWKPQDSDVDYDNYPPHSTAAPDLSSRRRLMQQGIMGAAATAASGLLFPTRMRSAWAVEVAEEEKESMYAPKFVQSYADFTEMDGWSYRDVTTGKASSTAASLGDRVVFDWSGYTIGYFGRPFQAKGGPQGGAFDKDLDYERTVLGSGQMVPGLEKGLMGMQAGGVRQIVLPYGPFSYPNNDPTHDRVGPKPSTFSGQRALNFVLENPRVDRTLLFNVKVIRVDKPNGKGGFVRG